MSPLPVPAMEAAEQAFLEVMRAQHPELVWTLDPLPVKPDDADTVPDRSALAA